MSEVPCCRRNFILSVNESLVYLVRYAHFFLTFRVIGFSILDEIFTMLQKCDLLKKEQFISLNQINVHEYFQSGVHKNSY